MGRPLRAWVQRARRMLLQRRACPLKRLTLVARPWRFGRCRCCVRSMSSIDSKRRCSRWRHRCTGSLVGRRGCCSARAGCVRRWRRMARPSRAVLARSTKVGPIGDRERSRSEGRRESASGPRLRGALGGDRPRLAQSARAMASAARGEVWLASPMCRGHRSLGCPVTRRVALRVLMRMSRSVRLSSGCSPLRFWRSLRHCSPRHHRRRLGRRLATRSRVERGARSGMTQHAVWMDR
jgi:hypothetical protein